MDELTVESVFGTKAGIIWNALNDNGPSTIGNLVKTTSLSREEICCALGWLGRENKILIDIHGRAMIFSLREAEGRWNASEDTTIGDAMQEDQAIQPTGATQDNAKAARSAKAQITDPAAVKRALAFILSEFEANREPTPIQVSKAVGMYSRQLGKALSRLDLKPESIRKGGRSVKVYPLALKAQVWELAALDEDGLEKMAVARARATESREENQERYTVFD